jgi:hypothetical protein
MMQLDEGAERIGVAGLSAGGEVCGFEVSESCGLP